MLRATSSPKFMQSGSGYSDYVDTSSIVWTGTTAPSGTLTAHYRWQQVGKTVSLIIGISYSVAGSALSAMTMNLPTGAPTPANTAGLGASASNIMYVGAVAAVATDTGTPGNNNKCGMYKNATNDGYQIATSFGSTNTKNMLINIDYTAA